ncbi:uncharacterized protein LOC107620384 [Arachis ipaensis]|uniref:uncharacterized protein LOC107620384 n=1 Tax=Arachis ipaensis TaxID=130454 RepID=UPI0007AF97C0|nr:uncharacterized protein LOC107620384 [Arachis ipaensis]
MHYRDLSVIRLGFHLPDEQPVVFKDDECLDDVARKASVKESMFLGWFKANKTNPEARCLTYVKFPSKFVWKPDTRKWFLQKSHSVIGWIFFVPPRSGEIYYLRLLLNFLKGPTCYEDIKTIDGAVYSSFRDACYAMGLLDDDKEYIDTIKEASHWGLGEYLRKLFLRYNRRKLVGEHAAYLQQLTDEQRVVYNSIMEAVDSGRGGVFFLYGYSVRSKGQIALIVASSGIASLLLPGGRTAHSRFAILLKLDEFSTCNIKQGSALAELITKAKIII